MISIISLYESVRITQNDYTLYHKHGKWGKVKAANKSDSLSKEFLSTLTLKQQGKPMDPTGSFIHCLMALVKSGGHHHVGSYRTILVQNLYKRLRFGNIDQEELAENPKWRETRDRVYAKLNEIANDPTWQEAFGVEYLTLNDHFCMKLLMQTQPQLQPLLASLGLEQYDHNKEKLLANCRGILDPDVNAPDLQFIFQLDRKRIERINEIKAAQHEKHTEARLISIVQMAASVLNHQRFMRVDLGELPFDPLPEETLDFWLENGPVKAENEEHRAMQAMFPG